MPKIYIPVAVQRAILELSQGYCEYCVLPSNFSTDFFHYEHIYPIVLGGQTEIANLARSCGICNNNKRDKVEHKDPLTQQMVRLFHPRLDTWIDHFQWSENDLYLIGITPIGRATIDLLKLNRVNATNLRKLLKMADLHPPDFSIKPNDILE
jgi:HNH endonuclease